jgi:hypothetical protein
VRSATVRLVVRQDWKLLMKQLGGEQLLAFHIAFDVDGVMLIREQD